MRLDRSRPFAEVYGRLGVAYEQDGRNYRPDGSLVGEEAPAVVPPKAEPEPPPAEPAKRPVGRPRKITASMLAQQFAGYDDAEEVPAWLPAPSERDVLAGYRDLSPFDASPVWVDGV